MPGKKSLNGTWNYIEDPNDKYGINFIMNISTASDIFKSVEFHRIGNQADHKIIMLVFGLLRNLVNRMI